MQRRERVLIVRRRDGELTWRLQADAGYPRFPFFIHVEQDDYTEDEIQALTHDLQRLLAKFRLEEWDES